MTNLPTSILDEWSFWWLHVGGCCFHGVAVTPHPLQPKYEVPPTYCQNSKHQLVAKSDGTKVGYRVRTSPGSTEMIATWYLAKMIHGREHSAAQKLVHEWFGWGAIGLMRKETRWPSYGITLCCHVCWLPASFGIELIYSVAAKMALNATHGISNMIFGHSCHYNGRYMGLFTTWFCYPFGWIRYRSTIPTSTITE